MIEQHWKEQHPHYEALKMLEQVRLCKEVLETAQTKNLKSYADNQLGFWGANGVFEIETNTIFTNDELRGASTAPTLAHELKHSDQHYDLDLGKQLALKPLHMIIFKRFIEGDAYSFQKAVTKDVNAQYKTGLPLSFEWPLPLRLRFYKASINTPMAETFIKYQLCDSTKGIDRQLIHMAQDELKNLEGMTATERAASPFLKQSLSQAFNDGWKTFISKPHNQYLVQMGVREPDDLIKIIKPHIPWKTLYICATLQRRLNKL